MAVLLVTGPLVAGPLHEAVREGDAERLGRLVRDGLDPMETVAAELTEVGEQKQVTPLHLAAARGDSAAVRALVGDRRPWRRQLLQAETSGGYLPLDLAVLSGDGETTRNLLAAGADPQRSPTPLHKAVRRDYGGVAVALLDFGAKIDQTDEQGRTPLHIAAAEGNNQMARLLVFKGARRSAKDDQGQTPQDLARRNGHRELLKVLDPSPEVTIVKWGLALPVVTLAIILLILAIIRQRHIKKLRTGLESQMWQGLDGQNADAELSSDLPAENPYDPRERNE
ncbi:MAG: ankyrin repeat domain-containing protein [Phycisphaerae bacterium]